MAVTVRIRSLTKQKRRRQVNEANALRVILKEMDIHAEAVAEYLKIPHHKLGSKYQPTFRYTDSVEAVPAHETKAELVAAVRVNAVELARNKNYTVYVGGDETGEGQQTGWVGDWPIIAEAVRGGGSTGVPTWKQSVGKAVKRIVES